MQISESEAAVVLEQVKRSIAQYEEGAIEAVESFNWIVTLLHKTLSK
jgi:hypothetical protein